MQLPMGFMQEQFLDGQRAAEFLGLPRKTLLNRAGRGSVPAHPIGDGMRHTSRFRHAGEAPTLMSILDDPQKQSAAHRESNPKRLRLQLDKRSKSGVLGAYIGALPGDYRGPVGPELRPISTAGLTHARANEGDRHDAE